MQQRLAQGLTYAGALPLVLSALALTLGYISPAGATLLCMSYSAIILSFLSGIHWAVYLFFAAQCPRNLLLTSNIVALLAWLSLLAMHSTWVLLLQILCFLYLLVLDAKLHTVGLIPRWFFSLRRNVTTLVVLTLCSVMGQL
jgi:hypothetical protein